MRIERIPLPDTHSFNSFFLDYIQESKPLTPFYNRFPKPENFGAQIEEKSKSFDHSFRERLCESLRRQYAQTSVSSAVKANIDSLSASNTYTITTGHQLNLFTGPLYFIYKIVTVIDTCRALKAMYPEHHFVPVYWMASEDHDFAEINHFRLKGNTHFWNTDQSGAVGRFRLDGISSMLTEIPECPPLFSDAYTKNNTLGAAVRHYVNALFGDQGLVVVDGDDPILKSAFRKIMADDLFAHTPQQLINKTDEALENLGYKIQVHARPINLFYLDEGMRERIESRDGSFNVLNSPLRFSRIELQQLLEKNPEKFSPNVVLRPLYQEVILPNLAYVGGPAEMVYWLQLKAMFDHYDVTFPILLPRNFAMLIEESACHKIEKAGLKLDDIFKNKETLINEFTLNNTDHNLSINGEREAIANYFNLIREQAERVDKSLGPFVGAEAHKTLKTIEKIEQKMLKAEKRILSDKFGQIERIKEKLFPEDHLQERTDNFLNFYPANENLINDLLTHFDPFDFRFQICIL